MSLYDQGWNCVGDGEKLRLEDPGKDIEATNDSNHVLSKLTIRLFESGAVFVPNQSETDTGDQK